MMFFKAIANPTFAHFSFFYECQNEVDPIQPHLSNILNPKMNNLEQIDYAVSDWIADNDVCISRASQEFPRMTSRSFK
jgi:hypothetical protein